MIHQVTDEQLQHILLWVEDLEKTKADQARHQLRKDPRSSWEKRAWCCLGRLCVVERVSYDLSASYPPPAVSRRTGLDVEMFQRYADFNDKDGLTFREIAAQIRRDFDLPPQPPLSVS